MNLAFYSPSSKALLSAHGPLVYKTAGAFSCIPRRQLRKYITRAVQFLYASVWIGGGTSLRTLPGSEMHKTHSHHITQFLCVFIRRTFMTFHSALDINQHGRDLQRFFPALPHETQPLFLQPQRNRSSRET